MSFVIAKWFFLERILCIMSWCISYFTDIRTWGSCLEEMLNVNSCSYLEAIVLDVISMSPRFVVVGNNFFSTRSRAAFGTSMLQTMYYDSLLGLVFFFFNFSEWDVQHQFFSTIIFQGLYAHCSECILWHMDIFSFYDVGSKTSSKKHILLIKCVQIAVVVRCIYQWLKHTWCLPNYQVLVLARKVSLGKMFFCQVG